MYVPPLVENAVRDRFQSPDLTPQGSRTTRGQIDTRPKNFLLLRSILTCQAGALQEAAAKDVTSQGKARGRRGQGKGPRWSKAGGRPRGRNVLSTKRNNSCHPFPLTLFRSDLPEIELSVACG